MKTIQVLKVDVLIDFWQTWIFKLIETNSLSPTQLPSEIDWSYLVRYALTLSWRRKIMTDYDKITIIRKITAHQTCNSAFHADFPLLPYWWILEATWHKLAWVHLWVQILNTTPNWEKKHDTLNVGRHILLDSSIKSRFIDCFCINILEMF